MTERSDLAHCKDIQAVEAIDVGVAGEGTGTAMPDKPCSSLKHRY